MGSEYINIKLMYSDPFIIIETKTNNCSLASPLLCPTIRSSFIVNSTPCVACLCGLITLIMYFCLAL